MGVLAFAVVVYWLLITTEGTYLGTRVVVLLYDWTARRYNAIKAFGFVDEARFVGLPLAEFLERVPNATFLDVATGTGRTLLALAAIGDLGATLVGVDRSLPMLRQAQRDLAERGVQATLIRGDAHSLMLADGSLDAVTCLEALEFMRDPRQVVREMVRVLRPGGAMLVSNRVGLEAWLFPGRYCRRGRLEALLAQEGLVEIESRRWQVDYDLIWVRRLEGRRSDVKRDFVDLADLEGRQVEELLRLAAELKADQKAGRARPVLAGRSLAMVFQKPSLRTRVSFDMAMYQLGGHALYLSPDEIRLGEHESIPDAARVLSRYVDAIMARVFAHTDVQELARWASVPVINGLSDYSHPCQAMADLLTIQEKMGALRGVRLTYLGDGNNVLHSLLVGGALMGMHVVGATPEGYRPLPEVVALAERLAERSGGSVRLTDEPLGAVAEADVLYTDTWTSMGQEAESARRSQVFPPYQINERLLSHGRSVVGVMHCLPAHRGQEITDEVADGPLSWLFDQAENRLHAQKAILVYVLEG